MNQAAEKLTETEERRNEIHRERAKRKREREREIKTERKKEGKTERSKKRKRQTTHSNKAIHREKARQISKKGKKKSINAERNECGSKGGQN